MPVLMIKTNVELPEGGREALLRGASRAVAEMLGKPERYVMVSLEAALPMLFAGSGEPLAYLELKSIGLPEGSAAEFSQLLCTLMGDALGVPSGRVYIEFSDAERRMWGWDGGTF